MASAETPPTEEERAANRKRFELELEFVQALANPYYLQSLAGQGILTKPAFRNYLSYLTYWREPEYARFIHYPQALHHLELLQNPQFCEDIRNEGWMQLLAEQQREHWHNWCVPRMNRTIHEYDM